jgi:two-component system response regulator PilR (NtrC family)
MLVPHVLVVEDCDAIRRALELLLGQVGYRVTTAASVAEGLERLDRQHVALLDLMLPDGSGTELLAEIRRRGSGMRVAVLSAAGPAAAEGLRACPPDRFFAKPVDVEALLDWIGAADATQKREGSASAVRQPRVARKGRRRASLK